MKPILFIFRSFNDLDHMLPIVDHALNNNRSIILTCINSEFDMKDFRIQYLKNKFSFCTEYIYQLYKPSLAYHLFNLFVCILPNTRLVKSVPLANTIIRKIRNIVHDRLVSKLYDPNWASNMIQSFNIGSIIVDYGDIKRFIYGSIKVASNINQIKIIGVPHGFDTISSDLWTTNGSQTNNYDWKNDEWDWINKLIVASPDIQDKYTRHGVSPSKMKIIGLPRFTPDWISIYHNMIPKSNLENEPVLKIIFFDHAASNYKGDPDQIYNTLRKVDSLPYTKLIVKPHTREKLSDSRLANIGKIDNSHSTQLILWSDIVINYMSSIVIDALLLKKIFLFPKYFIDNTLRWEKYGACWTVYNQSELLSALEAIQKGTHTIPYNQNNVDDFLNNEIYQTNHLNVCERYLDFINLHSTVN
ncbi:MAG: hypothetical protein CL743_01815 [Chloroflexi bacterium]|nr:hypothetical protein [Chloroflexota bacterium]